MRITVRAGQVGHIRQGLQVYGALEGDRHPERLLPASSARDQQLKQLVTGSGFRGAPNEIVLLPKGTQWVLVVGLGKAKELSIEKIRQCAGTAARTARAQGFTAVTLPVIVERGLGPVEVMAQASAEGALLGLYRYDKLKQLSKHEQSRRIEAITLVVEQSGDLGAAKHGAHKGQVIAEAVSLARDLINGPSNLVTPTVLADEARKIAKQFRLKCTVIPFARLKQLGFGGIVGVAQGASHPAQFIVLEYKPAPRPAGRNRRGGRATKTYALCGKGITFDTGGINIKPSAKMELMKYDMAGAAAVLGTIKAAATLKLPVRIIGIIAATDNMPSGSAQKPGDVLTTLSGKTVEVLNTDAEGRLVLTDCLHYAKRFKPDYTIDLATLTGACVIALGSEAVGLMGNDEKLAERITKAGEQTHERVWRLPMWEEYGGQLIKSDIADLRNVTNTGEAGTITAAKFLEAFVEGMHWAHLDIAGTAWSDKPKPYIPKGAVGIGVRLLIELMEKGK
ncbi:MAG: leucyl aminopeptidase [Candidatus Omnitrophica bacterium]|nr:leucyl aminopeptidase [Candidatus Omnitrophota bacterium]